MPLPRVIITGSRGRVGRAIQSALKNEWHMQPCSRSAGEGVLSLDSLLEGTRTSLEADLIIHGAWSCLPASAEEAPGQIEQVDLPLLDRLVARLKEDSVPPLTLFISTGAVYGPAGDRPSRETDTPRPLGAYARGKLAAEDRLRASGLPVCILRVGNLYGLPSRPEDRQGVIARMVRCALSGSPFQKWGEDPVKDYLHSDDFFAALRLVAQQRLEGTWNVASGMATPLSTLLSLVAEHTGAEVPVRAQPSPEWDVTDNRLDISRFSAATGWQPRMDLREGVRREVQALGGLGL